MPAQHPSATPAKFRKGACENCGAVSHKTKECMERPRAKGARWTLKDVKPDEVVKDIALDWDAKRDRWNGYDPAEHMRLVQEHEYIEEARRKRKAQELDKALAQAAEDGNVGSTLIKVAKTATGKKLNEFGFESSDSEAEEEDKYAEHAGVSGQKFDPKTRVTVRNLRLREDTAKYLINLDPDSAYYDPKTRSMREDPNLGKVSSTATTAFRGDNFVRWTGDAKRMQDIERFAWDTSEKVASADLVMQANPTLMELQHKKQKVSKETEISQERQSLLEKYGGAEHLVTDPALPKELLLHGQSETYVEYSREGKVIVGNEKPVAKSKYPEDVFINNHTSVWGSYWKDGAWGYHCCHSFMKNSYCIPLTDNPDRVLPAIK